MAEVGYTYQVWVIIIITMTITYHYDNIIAK